MTQNLEKVALPLIRREVRGAAEGRTQSEPDTPFFLRA
jgi:hypothetical protein